MANRLTHKLVTSALGYCCLYGFFAVKRGFSTKQIADYLGVSPRTIRNIRQQIEKGDLSCTGVSRCQGYACTVAHTTLKEKR